MTKKEEKLSYHITHNNVNHDFDTMNKTIEFLIKENVVKAHLLVCKKDKRVKGGDKIIFQAHIHC